MFRVGRHTYVGGMCRSYRYPLPATPSGGAGLDGSPASPSQEHAFTSRWDGVQHEGGITGLAAGVRCCPLITARTGWHESLRLVRPVIDIRTCVLVCQMVLAGGDLRVAAPFLRPTVGTGLPRHDGRWENAGCEGGVGGPSLRSRMTWKMCGRPDGWGW